MFPCYAGDSSLLFLEVICIKVSTYNTSSFEKGLKNYPDWTNVAIEIDMRKVLPKSF